MIQIFHSFMHHSRRRRSFQCWRRRLWYWFEWQVNQFFPLHRHRMQSREIECKIKCDTQIGFSETSHLTCAEWMNGKLYGSTCLIGIYWLCSELITWHWSVYASTWRDISLKVGGQSFDVRICEWFCVHGEGQHVKRMCFGKWCLWWYW